MGRFGYSAPAAVAFALLFASVSVTPTLAQNSTNGTSVSVTGTDRSGVHFRATPGGASIGTFPDGTRLLVVGENQQASGRTWRNVRSPNGVVGWVAADYLSGTANAPESTTTQAAYRPGAAPGSSLQVVKTGGLNAVVRDNPGGTQIGSYPEGTSMTLAGAEARQVGGREWKNVRGPDGKTGWMASFLLSGDSGPTVADRSTLLSSRSPFTLTADMRSRALAARARAVPLAATGNSNKPTSTTDTKKESPASNTSSNSSSSTSSSSAAQKKP